MKDQKCETIDVTPSWWRTIHHKSSGAFPMAIQVALKSAPLVYELRATELQLLLVIPLGSVKADAVRSALESGIAIEPSDRLPDAPTDAAVRTGMTRKQFEVKLTEMEMHPIVEADGVWGVSTVSLYVRLPARGKDSGRCDVETNDGHGPRSYTYEGALAALEAFAQSASDVTEDEMGGDVSSLGTAGAPGGILRNRW